MVTGSERWWRVEVEACSAFLGNLGPFEASGDDPPGHVSAHDQYQRKAKSFLQSLHLTWPTGNFPCTSRNSNCLHPEIFHYISSNLFFPTLSLVLYTSHPRMRSGPNSGLPNQLPPVMLKTPNKPQPPGVFPKLLVLLSSQHPLFSAVADTGASL